MSAETQIRVEVTGLDLGGYYRDRATSFTGVAVAVWAKLGGGVQVALARIGADGRPFEVWFDAARLEPTSPIEASRSAHV